MLTPESRQRVQGVLVEVLPEHEQAIVELMSQNDVEMFNEMLAELRKSSKSQAALARDLDVSVMLLYFVIAGKRKPSEDLFRRVLALHGKQWEKACFTCANLL